MHPAEVFLSHATPDRAMAVRIAHALREHGIPTFFSPFNLMGAQQWQQEILAALNRCDWFVVLLSPDAVESMWVKRETAFALSDRRYENRIIPVSYRPCDLGPLEWLRIFQIVNFQNDFEVGCRELLRIWGVGFDPAKLVPQMIRQERRVVRGNGSASSNRASRSSKSNPKCRFPRCGKSSKHYAANWKSVQNSRRASSRSTSSDHSRDEPSPASFMRLPARPRY